MTKNLIPRHVFFSNPDITGVKISPDGQMISYIAPHEGVLNIWIAPVNDIHQAKAITFDTHRGVTSYAWSYRPHTLLYSQDNNGDENWHIFKLDIDTGIVTDLTPFQAIHARIEKISPNHPDQILIALNNRVPELHDIYRVDLKTHTLSVVYENNQYVSFLYNDNLEIKLACHFDGHGNAVYSHYDDGHFKEYVTVNHQDVMTTYPLYFNRAGDILYMIDSRNRETAALVALKWHTDEATVLYENPLADVSHTVCSMQDKQIKAVCSTYDYKKWIILDQHWQKHFDVMTRQLSGEIDIASQSYDDQTWIIERMRDDAPLEYYLYNRSTQILTFLFTNRTALENLLLCKMYPHLIKTRDNLTMVSYLTLPHEADPHQNGTSIMAVPLVLLVHGGPNARDVWGLNAQHQWLASRGYAVLSVNYRGSTGFGQKFINAGNGEWSLKMHDDLIDAVNWAIEHGITLRDEIAIMGGSYGGYATLVGLAMTPDVFCCGISIVGVSNLKTLMTSFPSYWKPIIQLMKIKVGGDMDTAEGEAELERRSPLFKAHAIKRPLLIGHGVHDPRVKIAESEQIVSKLKENNIPVTYATYNDEGHGFVRPENRLSFFAVTELFLHNHLGGRAEPIGNDFNKSSIEIVEGQNLINAAL